MPLKTSQSEELPSINLTPMIDVVFLLIIFFMVGTQFSDAERSIDIKLPNVGELKAMVTPPASREVAVTSEGTIMLDGTVATPAELTARLQSMRNQFPDLAVVVRADARVQYQRVAEVFSAVDGAGVKNLSTAALRR